MHSILKVGSVTGTCSTYLNLWPSACTLHSNMAKDLPRAQELATLEYAMLRYPPSVLAAAAVLVAEAHDEVAAMAAAAALQVRCSHWLLLTGCTVARVDFVFNA